MTSVTLSGRGTPSRMQACIDRRAYAPRVDPHCR